MSTKTQYLVQEVQNYGMITFWLMIISPFLELCCVGIITRLIGFIFLGLTLHRISLLVKDNSIINTYLLSMLTLCIHILSLLFLILSLVYVGKKTGISEFVRTAIWWGISFLSTYLVAIPFLLLGHLLRENPDTVPVLIVIGMLLAFLTTVATEIYAMLQWRAGLQRIAEMFTHEDGLVQS